MGLNGKCVHYYIWKRRSLVLVTFSENQSIFIHVLYRLRSLDFAVHIRKFYQGFINNLACKYTEAFSINNNNQRCIMKSRL